MTSQFLITAGSHLYGTNRPDSDLDIRGVYLESPEQIYGLKEARVIEKKDPDTAVYPLKKFVHLALQGNPNILEILFARSEYWILSIAEKEFFMPFVEYRYKFLSQRVRHTYIGYAKSQLYKIADGKSPTKNTRSHLIEKFGYDTKYAMHTIRLLIQVESILTHGDFDPTFYGQDLDNLIGVLNGDMSKEGFIDYASDLIRKIDSLPSDLSCEPDTDFIEGLLIDTYRRYL